MLNYTKKIGVIGGLGPEATAHFYQNYVSEYKRLNNNQYPQLYIYSLPISRDIEEIMVARGGDIRTFEVLKQLIVDALKSFETIGVQQTTILCNTLSPLVSEVSKIKFVSLIDSVLKTLKKRQYKKVMLLGSSALVNSNVYQQLLIDNSIRCVEPTKECQTLINELILCALSNSTNDEHKDYLVRNIVERSNKNDILLLACTDLSITVSCFYKYGVECVDSLSSLIEEMLNHSHENI